MSMLTDTIISNVASAIPPTLAALAALIATLRGNKKVEEVSEKTSKVQEKADDICHAAAAAASTAITTAVKAKEAASVGIEVRKMVSYQWSELEAYNADLRKQVRELSDTLARYESENLVMGEAPEKT